MRCISANITLVRAGISVHVTGNEDKVINSENSELLWFRIVTQPLRLASFSSVNA